MIKTSITLLLLFLSLSLLSQNQYSVKSPNGQLEIKITIDKKISYSVLHQGDILIYPSNISMQLEDGRAFGVASKVKSVKRNKINQIILSPIYKKSEMHDFYNELVVTFKDNFDLVFRAYNEGTAYRFTASQKNDFVVKSEEASFNFGNNKNAYISYVKQNLESFESQLFNSFENVYKQTSINDWDKKNLSFLPLLVEMENEKKIVISEADLFDYPGMFLYNGGANSCLTGYFATHPKTVVQGGHNMLQELVQERENYIAKCKAKTNFPWRIIAVSAQDKELLDNDLVYKLASPNRVKDVSWIKPGKVAWDWWNNWNLYGVDFQTGINNTTYKAYIDFASKNNIEYVILDEGWAVNKKADLFQVIPEINLEELIKYGNERNVGLILWAGYYALNKDIEKVCKHYSKMGIKGFKVDFMDRDDQEMVNFHNRTAEIAANYHLLIDFHGTYKPTGLQRTYPNVINYEGVYGLENMKWDNTVDQVTYDVTVPFIRMVAGPMDYTQGAMKNANKANYRAVLTEPMSQGTRCRQLAQYIIFEAPLTMLCDSPSNYEREPESTNFIASVPTVWDETIALDGKLGEYIVIARRKGNDWYVGAMTDWNKRDIQLNLSFLSGNNYRAEIFKDGVNAGKAARDYKKETIDVPVDKKLEISLASGGGCVVKIIKK
ncbi:glycoside hydrolase family 97 protein [Paludibacter sp.]